MNDIGIILWTILVAVLFLLCGIAATEQSFERDLILSRRCQYQTDDEKRTKLVWKDTKLPVRFSDWEDAESK